MALCRAYDRRGLIALRRVVVDGRFGCAQVEQGIQADSLEPGSQQQP